jgi:hypothetical protein
MLKDKFQVKSVLLLGLLAIILLLLRQQQATISSQSENSWSFEKLQWLWSKAWANPSSEKIDPKTLSNGMHVVIKLSDRRVYVYYNRQLKESYPVAIGKAGWETPIGNYKVMDMQPHPIWEHPWTGEIILEGPKNPLGARWIGFWTDGRNSIGFHGTPAEQLVGQAVSHGCVRMRNKDILALYEQVKMGTPVTVKP